MEAIARALFVARDTYQLDDRPADSLLFDAESVRDAIATLEGMSLAEFDANIRAVTTTANKTGRRATALVLDHGDASYQNAVFVVAPTLKECAVAALALATDSSPVPDAPTFYALQGNTVVQMTNAAVWYPLVSVLDAMAVVPDNDEVLLSRLIAALPLEDAVAAFPASPLVAAKIRAEFEALNAIALNDDPMWNKLRTDLSSTPDLLTLRGGRTIRVQVGPVVDNLAVHGVVDNRVAPLVLAVTDFPVFFRNFKFTTFSALQEFVLKK